MTTSLDELVALTAHIERTGVLPLLPDNYGFLLLVMMPQGDNVITGCASNVTREIVRAQLVKALAGLDEMDDRL